MKRNFLLLFLITVQYAAVANASIDTGVQKILFLGNSITYAGNYITDVEVYLLTHHPDKKFEIINMGLPSETVSGLSEEGHADGKFPRPDLHERLDRVLALTHPDIVYACYGMNDGIYLPFEETRFQKFKEGINWLHDKVIRSGAKIIHVTPPLYDELKGKKIGYANTLDKYADWIIGQNKRAGWSVVDLHYPMKKFLEAHRKVDAEFKLTGFAFAEDGIHPNETGHWIMAKSILLYMGEKDVADKMDIRSAVAAHSNGEKIFQLAAQRQLFMKDAWLTAAGHTRPGMKKGIPLAEAIMKAKEIGIQIELLNR